MSRRLWISGPVRDWLTRLRAEDLPAARAVGEALVALTDETPGPPLVVPVDPARWTADPTATLDHAYQRRLVLLQRLRRAAADLATARKRLELQIAQLAANLHKLGSQVATADENGRPDLAQVTRERQIGLEETLAKLRAEFPALRREEENAIAAHHRLQDQTDLWRMRKERLKAEYTTGQARRLIGELLADAGEPADGGVSDGETETNRRAEDETVAAPHDLQELRLGALTGRDLYLLFCVEPPDIVLLLTAGEGAPDQAVRTAYDPVFFRGEETAESFLETFFPGEEADRRAGAVRLADRNRPYALAALRRRTGLTVERVAERMGVRAETVTAIEREEPVTTATLAAYVEALGGRLEIVADLGPERFLLR
jgi:phage shock protein A/DNA-binding XRE family transcriptional regulator